MHNRPNFKKYSVVTTGLLFSSALAVFIATGQPALSKPVVASLYSEGVTSYAASVQVGAPGSAAPYQYAAKADKQNSDLQAKADENKEPYSPSIMQKSTAGGKPAASQQPANFEQPAVSEPGLTVSDAQALAGKPENTNKIITSAEQPVSYRFVNANELNVRSGAGTDYEKVVTMKRKEKVELLSISGEWAKIRTSSGKTGYTLSEYLVAKESDVGPEEPIAYMFINADTLNVRSGASADTDKITTLKRGDKVGYFDKNGEWVRIQTSSGKTGYILSKYLVDDEKSVSRAEDSVSRASSAVSGDVTELAQQIADYSTNFQGVKYVYGGYSTKGFDCSGFVKYVYAHFGIAVPRTAADYAIFGEKVSRENLRPSDILLFDTDGGTWDVSHVGIYLGGDKFIHASTTKGRVIIMSLSEYRGQYYGARRVIK